MAISTVLLVAIPTTHLALRRSLREHFRIVETSHHGAAAGLQTGVAAVLIGYSAATVSAAIPATRALRSAHPHVPVIVLAESSSEQLAVAALRAGATDYYGASSSPEDLVAVLRRLVDGAPRAAGDPLVGSSAAMRGVCASLDRVARTEATVLITGETGTGKELAARRIHAASPRRARGFVSINCAAIPDTLIESELFGYERGAFTGAVSSRGGALQRAQGGTVFLDEVGDMSPVAQAKILRAIESREIVPLGGRTPLPIDVRIVAATNQDMEQAVAQGRFRKDLYFRLNVVRIDLPPLRERQSDIPALLAHYARHFGARMGPAPPGSAPGFTDDAVQTLRHYEWPGNVRELKNLVEGLFALAATTPIGVKDLPPALVARPASPRDDEAERARLLAVLLDARWNKSRAARQLQCSRMTLYRRMTRLRLVSSDK